jgi:hypothetical protein
LLDVFQQLDFLAVSALFAPWSSGKIISIVVLPALMVLGSEVVFFDTMDPAGSLPLEVLKTHVQCQYGVVSAQVEFLTI